MEIKQVIDCVLNSRPEWLEKHDPYIVCGDVKINWKTMLQSDWSIKFHSEDPVLDRAIRKLIKELKKCEPVNETKQ